MDSSATLTILDCLISLESRIKTLEQKIGTLEQKVEELNKKIDENNAYLVDRIYDMEYPRRY